MKPTRTDHINKSYRYQEGGAVREKSERNLRDFEEDMRLHRSLEPFEESPRLGGQFKGRDLEAETSVWAGRAQARRRTQADALEYDKRRNRELDYQLRGHDVDDPGREWVQPKKQRQIG